MLRRNRGVALRFSGTALTATDLVVSQTAGLEVDGTQGLGLVVDVGAKASLTRAVFERNRVVDILVSDLGTALTLVDARLRQTRSQASDGKWGVGFIAVNEADFVATRLTVERTDDSGGMAQSRALCILSDLIILDTGLGGPATSGFGLRASGRRPGDGAAGKAEGQPPRGARRSPKFAAAGDRREGQ